MGFNRERGLPHVPTVHVTRMRTSQRGRYHFMGCVRVRNCHLLCHSKVLRSAPFLQFSPSKFFFSSSFRKQCLEYGLPVARHRALLSPQHHLRVMRSQRLLSVPLSVYDLRHRCTNAGLDNSGRKADLVARLLEHHNVSSQPGPSTSGQPPLQRNNEDQSRLLDHTLRDTIRSEVTACVTAAVQNLLPSSSSTIDLTGNAGLLRSTHGQTGSTSVSLPTASVPSRTADRILRGEYIDFNDLLPEALGLAQHPLVSFISRSETTALSCLQTKAPAARGWSAMFTISAPGWRHGQRTFTSSFRLPPREPRSFLLTKRL